MCCAVRCCIVSLNVKVRSPHYYVHFCPPHNVLGTHQWIYVYISWPVILLIHFFVLAVFSFSFLSSAWSCEGLFYLCKIYLPRNSRRHIQSFGEYLWWSAGRERAACHPAIESVEMGSQVHVRNKLWNLFPFIMCTTTLVVVALSLPTCLWRFAILSFFCPFFFLVFANMPHHFTVARSRTSTQSVRVSRFNSAMLWLLPSTGHSEYSLESLWKLMSNVAHRPCPETRSVARRCWPHVRDRYRSSVQHSMPKQ